MCTVTIIPCHGGIRLAANRDEQRTRPAATAPKFHTVGAHRVLYPGDPVGCGTWIAATATGLVMTLLNVTDRPVSYTALHSRGVIIPSLLDAGELRDVVARTSALSPRDFAPFRLIVAERRECVEFRSDGNQMRLIRRVPITGPLMWTSSGLGDALVAAPRGKLFADLFRDAVTWQTQDAYHRHSWSEYPELSVCMRRPDARTVSHTLVTLTDCIDMTYHADAPDVPAVRTHRKLDLVRGAR